MIDSNLSWKKQVAFVLKKVRRGIGILSKICHYITKDILKRLYCTLFYPFIIYRLIAWGNTYKKAARVITFSSFDHHSNPLFKLLGIIYSLILSSTMLEFSCINIIIRYYNLFSIPSLLK